MPVTRPLFRYLLTACLAIAGFGALPGWTDEALPAPPLLAAVVIPPADAPPAIVAPADHGHPLAVDLTLAGLALIPLDATLMPKIQRATAGDRDNGVIGFINNFGTPQVALPIIGAIYLSHSPYDKTSAKMATASLVNAGVLVQLAKVVFGRARPETPSSTQGQFNGFRLDNAHESFPSGHTIVAFSVASVLAKRYPKYRWLCYGLASGVGLARVWKSAHFPSDVLVGAGLGVYTGDIAVRTGGRWFHYEW